MSRQIWQADNNTDTIRLSGEIDYTVTPDVRSYLLSEARKRSGEIHLDLEELEYIDSSGLAVLIELRRKLLENERSVKIVAASPQVRKLFMLTQVAQLFGM